MTSLEFLVSKFGTVDGDKLWKLANNKADGVANHADVQRLVAELMNLQAGYAAARLEIESLRASHGQAPAGLAVPSMSADEVNALPTAARAYIHQLATNTDPAGMVRENMQLRDTNAGLQSMYRKAADAAQEVVGCFHAAECEGLQAALAGTADEHLKDLVERRLMHALYAAQEVAGQAPAQAALIAVAGPWSAGELDGNWLEIDHKDHAGVIRIVWKMEDDARSPVCEARAMAVIDALNAYAAPTPPAQAAASGLDPELGPMLDFANAGEIAFYDYAVAQHCRATLDILDGKDNGAGACSEPWASVRKRLLSIVELHQPSSASQGDALNVTHKGRCQHCIDRHDGIYGSWAAPCPYHDDDGNPRIDAARTAQEVKKP